jgi:retrotransposon gag protein/zinc knuckle protein
MTTQSSQNVTHQLITNTNALNAKVDNLAATLEGLSLDDDLKQRIERQLAEIATQTSAGNSRRHEIKIKDLETYDGETKNLRSWLTAANLQIENKGVTGEEEKVKFIGGYLRGKAWNWFEPILRERETRNKREWSERAKRILGSYDEMKKAMNQVFGDVDERKTAAKKLQQLRQTKSVTEYITEFQTITSNLDWDDDALEDKFLEGLKNHVKNALIFFPTNPRNLEELFERAQKIDREYWNQRTTGPYVYGKEVSKRNRWEPRKVEQNRWEPRNYGPRGIKKDREGDVIMTGAKVSSEEARRKGLCYNCGRKGHLAKDCRQKKQKESETTDRQTRNPNVAIRMIRFNPGQVSDEDSKEEKNEGTENEREQVNVSSMFHDLSLEDFSTDESSNEEPVEDEEETIEEEENEDLERTKRIQKWRNDIERNKPEWTEFQPFTGPRSRLRRTIKKDLEFPGRLPEGRFSPEKAKGEISVPRIEKTVEKDDSQKARKSNERQLTFTERLAKMDFSNLTKENKPYWREFCNRRIANTEDELRVWIECERKLSYVCDCYGFDLNCWGMNVESWTRHTEHCAECRAWSNRSCVIPGHSAKSKNNILQDLGNRHQTHGIITNERGQTCCELGICIHEFIEHQEYDIPWWTCLNDNCKEHNYAKKVINTLPMVPRFVLLRDRKCPCLSRGCVCSLNRKHPFHGALLKADDCVIKTCNIHQKKEEKENELERLKERIEELTNEIKMLKAAKIGKTTMKEVVPQLKSKVMINRKEIEVTVDCGADVNYVNRKWCEQQRFQVKTQGYGWVKSYDGKWKNVPKQTTNIAFRMQGKYQRQIFKVLEETDEDLMVLGMPWLAYENPDIDWARRTIQLSNKASKDQGELTEHSDLRKMTSKTTKDNETLKESETEEKEYQKELKETQEKLPKEIKEFADVFCEKK